MSLSQRYVDGHLRRLRLLLERRILWLRHQWNSESTPPVSGLAVTDAEADRLLVGFGRDAERAFYEQDHRTQELTRSLRGTELELCRIAEEDSGEPPALERLTRSFGLSPFERDVIVLCWAVEREPSFGRLYAYAQDDAHRDYPTPDLARALFGDPVDDPDNRDSAFPPDAPLLRHRLVEIEDPALPGTPHAARPLRLDEHITGYLSGSKRPDERATSMLQPVSDAPLAPIHASVVDEVIGLLASRGGDRPWPVINLIGPSGAGKRVVARSICERFGLRLCDLDPAQLPQSIDERRERLRLIEREAVLWRWAIYMGTPAAESGEGIPHDRVREILDELHSVVLIGSHRPVQTNVETLPVSVPRLDPVAQRDVWRQVLLTEPNLSALDLDEIVEQFDFGPERIARTARAAQATASRKSRENGGGLTSEDLWHACRSQSNWHLEDQAQHINPCFTWQDIVLPEDTLLQLREIANQVPNRSTVYERWGFGAKLSRGRGISALFSGPSGTGKTMAAEILANHLNLDLYRIDLAGVVSKYIGETEKNLRRVFDAAERSGAILFFDEADALFGKRTEVKDSHDRYANIEVNYLLQRMEDYRGLAILATNRRSSLDRAFLRRLRFIVSFPRPDVSSRKLIWQGVFPKATTLGRLDYDALARLDISGGSIRNIALNAAFLAASEGSAVGMQQIMRAARREYAKIDKLPGKTAFGTWDE
ncbi:ATP-binding protein [Candidatus Bipolaricaulota bacterium]